MESRVFKGELYLIFLFVTTLSPSFFASLWWHRSKGRHEGSRKWWIALPRNPFFVDFSKYSQQTPLSWSNNKNNNKKVNLGKKNLLLHSRMLHDPKTVIGSDFDQETAEKIAPPFIPRLELANCTCGEILCCTSLWLFSFPRPLL